MTTGDPWREVWAERTPIRADWNGYEACFDSIEEYEGFVQASARFVREILAPGSQESLLDIGCGTGRLTEVFAPEVRQVTGLDYSPVALDVARSRAPANARYVLADLNTCGDESLTGYSKAFAFGSLMYLNSVTRAYEIMETVTSAGTELLVIDLPDATIADPRPRAYSREQYPHLGFIREELLRRFPGANVLTEDLPGYVNGSHRFAALIPARKPSC